MDNENFERAAKIKKRIGKLMEALKRFVHTPHDGDDDHYFSASQLYYLLDKDVQEEHRVKLIKQTKEKITELQKTFDGL